jgi:hypothetical protein
MDIYTDARPFYGGLYRCHPDLARSINNKSFYNHLWPYGLYGALHRMPWIGQVLLMRGSEFNSNLMVSFLSFYFLRLWRQLFVETHYTKLGDEKKWKLPRLLMA